MNETLRLGLAARKNPKPKRYRLKPTSMGRSAHGIDINKALSLAAALGDEEIARKLELPK